MSGLEQEGLIKFCVAVDVFQIRFQLLEFRPVIWHLTPAGQHNVINEVRAFRRGRHPVAVMGDLMHHLT